MFNGSLLGAERAELISYVGFSKNGPHKKLHLILEYLENWNKMFTTKSANKTNQAICEVCELLKESQLIANNVDQEIMETVRESEFVYGKA